MLSGKWIDNDFRGDHVSWIHKQAKSAWLTRDSCPRFLQAHMWEVADCDQVTAL
jgi:hypothetical protein